jgi:hypothetical protein
MACSGSQFTSDEPREIDAKVVDHWTMSQILLAYPRAGALPGWDEGLGSDSGLDFRTPRLGVDNHGYRKPALVGLGQAG